MAYQSLYRRYRPRRFSEVRGQEHLVSALRNAVREDRVGHAYLFSGPRGTGKTSTARILAKVLNCENPVDGEPECTCASCVSIEAGTSFDVHELDAASNNGVEAVRDLIAKASLGTPGRTKVYILDEVHMLSVAASNALLKTLEEPPEHVVFVLATTDPQKVLPTIRSRTQHFEVHLLPAADLEGLVDDVVADAGLALSPEGRAHVLRAGGGSARDTLSALDRVVAAGGVPDTIDAVDELVEALCDRDTARALIAIDAAMSRGRNARVLGESLIARLRDVFLASVQADLSRLSDQDRDRVSDQAGRLTAAGATRALELLGDAFVGIQDALDPRIPLEVALVRLTRADADTSVAALAERLSMLEQHGVTPAGTPAKPPASPSSAPGAPAAPAGRATPSTPPSALTAPDGGEAPSSVEDDRVTGGGGDPGDGSLDPAAAAEENEATMRAMGENDAPVPSTGRPADGARQVLRKRGTGPEPTAPAAPTQPSTTRTPTRPPSPPRANRPTPTADGATADMRPPESPSAEARAIDSNERSSTASTRSNPSSSSSPDSTSVPTMSMEAEAEGPSPGTDAKTSTSSAAPTVGLPSRDELTLAWGDSLLSQLPQRAKVRFAGGHWVSTDDDTAVFGLPNQVHASRCEECRGDVEAALATHFGRPVPIRLVVDGSGPDPSAPHLSVAPDPIRGDGGDGAEESIDPSELTDASDAATSGVDRVTTMFPGAELVPDNEL